MDQSSASFSPPPAVVESAICRLLGVLFSCGLYGCLFVQFYNYCVTFDTDTWRLRALVYFIMAVETAQTIMLLHFAIDTFGTHFGVVAYTMRVGINWLSVPFLTAVVGGTVEIFLIFRIHYLSKMRIFPAFLFLMTLLHAGARMALGLLGSKYEDYRQFGGVKSMDLASAIAGPVAMTVDVLIAGALVYSLRQLRTGVRRSEAVIWRLSRLFIETGCLTAFAQLSITTLYQAFKSKPYHITMAFCLSRLYAINLLAIQNSRADVKSALTHQNHHRSSFFDVPRLPGARIHLTMSGSHTETTDTPKSAPGLAEESSPDITFSSGSSPNLEQRHPSAVAPWESIGGQKRVPHHQTV